MIDVIILMEKEHFRKAQLWFVCFVRFNKVHLEWSEAQHKKYQPILLRPPQKKNKPPQIWVQLPLRLMPHLFSWVPRRHVLKSCSSSSCAAAPPLISRESLVTRSHSPLRPAGWQTVSQPATSPDLNPTENLRDALQHNDWRRDLCLSRASSLVRVSSEVSAPHSCTFRGSMAPWGVVKQRELYRGGVCVCAGQLLVDYWLSLLSR